jgi:predicted O-methyltransferase YrrM
MREAWERTDDYIVEHQLGRDAVLEAAIERAAREGIPPSAVSRAQAELLAIMVGVSGARRVLEIGTLAGCSTIQLARAAGDEGSVTTVEPTLHHAEVAAAGLVSAGLSDRVEIQVGPALELLAEMLDEPPAAFDFVLIDAGLENAPEHFMLARRLCRPGAMIVVAGVVGEGALTGPAAGDPAAVGRRQLLSLTGSDDSVRATTIQTVGHGGWDGLTIAVV